MSTEKIDAFDSSSEREGSSSEFSGVTFVNDEARALRKVDLTVLPLLTIGLFVFQLDRVNLASALTGGFMKDVSINQDTVNLGNQLMFLGIVLLEIPSNMILQRVGPRKYMAAQVFIFGLVATMQTFLKNKTGFLVSRSILGLCEAGYIPGSLYILSTWYRSEELAKRIAIFFFGMFAGTAFSPLLASAILKLDDYNGVRGWRWIFMIEGLMTVFISAILLLFLPGSPQRPKPLLFKGLIRFTPRDQEVLQHRLERNGTRLTDNSMIITPQKVWQTVTHWRRWPHYISTCAVFATWAPLTTYTPTIIMNLGFERIPANALTSIGGIISLITVFIFALISDRTNRRGFTVALAISCYLIALILLRTIHPSVSNKWRRYVLWTLVNSFAVGYHPVHNTWLQLNCTDPQERSIAIAMWVMSAISGLMAGSQVFRAKDAPWYGTGVAVLIGMVGFGLVLAVMQIVVYWVFNRKLAAERKKMFELKGTLLVALENGDISKSGGVPCAAGRGQAMAGSDRKLLEQCSGTGNSVGGGVKSKLAEKG
ncbi:inner membrane transporter yfaV [Ascodesmis nigricans]|uniref:Inner membrane transporter yfaV n=1 Tax=Ascodesmis nigricans TaxID=341454 RepID=A0A4S2MIM4_9PEZI|nr:inner membrane transporter yfaV [Ascodesmis nigricans]